MSVQEDVVHLYWDCGFSISQTAKLRGISDTNVRKWLKRSGRGSRSISDGAKLSKGTSDITDEKILELYNQNWSCQKISYHFGKSRDFARQRLMALGIKRKNNSMYNKQRSHFTDEDHKKI